MADRVPIWRKSLGKRQDTRAFLTKHNRAITFVGAFIVFTTFVVKEAIGDNIKNLLSDIQTARSIYQIRHDMGTLAAQLRVLEEGLKAKDTNVEPTRVASQRGGNAEKYIQAVRDFQNVTSQFIADGNRYARDLRDFGNAVHSVDYGVDLLSNIAHDVNDPQLKSFVARMTERAQEIQKLSGDINSILQKEGQEVKNLDIASARSSQLLAEGKLADLENKIKELTSEQDAANSKTLASAEYQKDKLESAHDSVLIVSYILYLVGWGLALVGRMYGVEVPGLG